MDVAPEASWGPAPGHAPPGGDRSDYRAAPDYRPAPDYGPAPDYRSAPDYGAASDYGAAPGHGDRPAYGAHAGYGEGPDYDPRPAYGEGPGPHAASGHHAAPGSGAGYGDEPDYGSASGYREPEPGYREPEPGHRGPGPGYDHGPEQTPAPGYPGPYPDRALEAPQPQSRAGRNLPVAIGVGVTLGALVIGSLYFWRPAFVVLATAAIAVAIWEMVRAVEPVEARPPLPPLLIGGAAIMVLAWFAGIEAMVLGLVLTVLAVLVWRLSDGPVGYQRDVTAATLIAAYVPFLAGFAVLLTRPEDGAFRVTLMMATVVLSDVGGYAAGVLFGRHPMAPRVSPKKSWEGFGGSLLFSAVGAAVMMQLMLGRPWWMGAVFGVALAFAATLGDLSESLMKRDLGIKDMGQLLPGHGGLMDRLDSLLLAAPFAYLLLALLAPPTG
ncbi:MAG: phosphatidate cytidylyltransferase [Micromonosporaceae bacterium]